MFSDFPSKICIILSACVHMAILYPWPFVRLMSRPEISFQKIELTYFKDGLMDDILVRDIKPITSIRQQVKKKEVKVAKLEMVEVEMKDEGEVRIKEAEKKKDTAESKPSEAQEDSQDEKSEAESVSKEAKEGEVLENYFLAVRERIKSILDKNKQGFTNEGKVYVKFVVQRNGSLRDVALYRRSGRNMRLLEEAVIHSIKEAAPFPPFSDEIHENQLLFKLPIWSTYYPQ